MKLFFFIYFFGLSFLRFRRQGKVYLQRKQAAGSKSDNLSLQHGTETRKKHRAPVVGIDWVTPEAKVTSLFSFA